MAEKDVDRIAKVVFIPEDAEIVTVTIIRKIPYTPEEIAQLEKYEPTYTQVHTACFGTDGVDGFDALTGNCFYLDDNEKWHLIQSEEEEEIREESKEQKKEWERKLP